MFDTHWVLFLNALVNNSHISEQLTFSNKDGNLLATFSSWYCAHLPRNIALREGVVPLKFQGSYVLAYCTDNNAINAEILMSIT